MLTKMSLTKHRVLIVEIADFKSQVCDIPLRSLRSAAPSINTGAVFLYGPADFKWRQGVVRLSSSAAILVIFSVERSR